MTEVRRARSVSQLKSYTSCPLAFKLERLEKKPSPPAAWTIKGLAVHQAIQLWEESHRAYDWPSGYRNSFDIFRRKAEEKYPDLTQWIKTPSVKTTERDLELREEQGLKELEVYVNRALRQHDEWQPHRLEDGGVAVELPFELDLGDDLPFYLRGYIDLLQYWKADGTVTLSDIKTGSDDREDYRQLGAYRVALKECYDIDITYGRYWYTKLDRGSEWIDLSRYTPEYLLDQYSQLDRAIESGIFLPNPGKSKCKFCPVKLHCPEMSMT